MHNSIMITFLLATGYIHDFVMIQGIIGGICVRLPVSWVMSRITPVSLFKIGLATPIASSVQILLCIGFFVIMQHRYQTRKIDSKQKSH